ncbi:MAG: hypothetical protein PUD15_06315 [Prevotella sp.]|nr:hypothetical protein [Prevotella sp.]
MTNSDFLNAVSKSFDRFLKSGTSRSTAKLKPLHGFIARDIANRLGEGYTIYSQGYGNDRESDIQGRYVDKMVDITIKKGSRAVAGIAVKFVMQNYSQNSNNYFENMLGETANIRANRCPYFQVFIILDKLPYYNKKKEIQKWETFTEHNVYKYQVMSQDNIDTFYHTPNKTLIYVVHIPDDDDLLTLDDYINHYESLDFKMQVSNKTENNFGDAVILNDYETFMDKVYHTIMSL